GTGEDADPPRPHRGRTPRARRRARGGGAAESRRVRHEGHARGAAPARIDSGALVNRVVDRLLRRYAGGEAADVAGFVIGERVLDLGSAEGYVPAALAARTGTFACGVDVGTFRRVRVPY